MKNIVIGFIMISVIVSGFSQNDIEKSDPVAKEILEKLRLKYDSFTAFDIDFALKIKFPEEEEVVKTGKFLQQGDKYRLEMADQNIISDGKSVWIYFNERNEVQITDEEESEDEISLKSFLKIYEKDDYYFTLINEIVSEGKTIQQIDFSPKDRNSEFFKFRLSIDKEKLEIVEIKSFAKDGSRFTVSVSSFKDSKNIPSSTFSFDKAEYPGCYIEDLRID